MWLLAMFDLPVRTKQGKQNYMQFRKHLLRSGFTKMQFSVYVRHCASEGNAKTHASRIEHALPSDGEVRVLTITDKQYARMHVFLGKKRKPAENPPRQLELF